MAAPLHDLADDEPTLETLDDPDEDAAQVALILREWRPADGEE